MAAAMSTLSMLEGGGTRLFPGGHQGTAPHKHLGYCRARGVVTHALMALQEVVVRQGDDLDAHVVHDAGHCNGLHTAEMKSEAELG